MRKENRVYIENLYLLEPSEHSERQGVMKNLGLAQKRCLRSCTMQGRLDDAEPKGIEVGEEVVTLSLMTHAHRSSHHSEDH